MAYRLRYRQANHSLTAERGVQLAAPFDVVHEKNGTNRNGVEASPSNLARLATIAAPAQDGLPDHQCASPFTLNIQGDARNLPLQSDSVDLIVTSPPYWKKRDYGLASQIGQEGTPQLYTESIMAALSEWRRVLKRTGSVFLNIGDTYWRKTLAAVPSLVEAAARSHGWIVRNRIIWAKDGGMPDPARNRLASRHEYILHLVTSHDYYYDLHGYAARFGNGANPGDVWHFSPGRRIEGHLAPFPDELVERTIYLACPPFVCQTCSKPSRRVIRRTSQLDLNRPQAKRAVELARSAGLTEEHIAAIQATGVSDAGKALQIQNGTGRNSARVKTLAAEAKRVLGGYFREFTLAKRQTVGWTECSCGAGYSRGVVLDPFMGTGTTLRVAANLGRSAIGVDLKPEPLPGDNNGISWNGSTLWQAQSSSPH